MEDETLYQELPSHTDTQAHTYTFTDLKRYTSVYLIGSLTDVFMYLTI